MDRDQAWLEAREYSSEDLETARQILEEIRAGTSIQKAVRHHPLDGGGYVGKHALVHVYRQMTDSGEWDPEPSILKQLRLKPVRTLSGVTTVTVLTKPYPCPGKCIFCPTDARLPKSYLADEPGAMRGLHHEFDPYDQTAARIAALDAIGHPTDKVELLVLGGTWSAYPPDYQRWFLQRCLDAMNGFSSQSLEEAQSANESAEHRNVGLVVETRPDHIDIEEILRLREYGVTKVQMGVQSLDDHILAINHRGHTVAQTHTAMRLLRAAGFKVVLHWMPNLMGATLESDQKDFQKLWDDPELRGDELKIYPCQLLENTELYEYWESGEYQPYSTDELTELIADLKTMIPRYCRVNRVIRDIPSDHVVAGNKRTSLRQDIQRVMADNDQQCECIRCREVRGKPFDVVDLEFHLLRYSTGTSEEGFLSYDTPEGDLAAYLRLSLPSEASPTIPIDDLEDAAIIRELHVYGQSLELGVEADGIAQHSGLGGELLQKAEELAVDKGFRRIAVIAALGTRGYYRKFGYSLGTTYMVKDLKGSAINV